MPPALSGRGSSGDDTWGRVEAKAGLFLSMCSRDHCSGKDARGPGSQ